MHPTTHFTHHSVSAECLCSALIPSPSHAFFQVVVARKGLGCVSTVVPFPPPPTLPFPVPKNLCHTLNDLLDWESKRVWSASCMYKTAVKSPSCYFILFVHSHTPQHRSGGQSLFSNCSCTQAGIFFGERSRTPHSLQIHTIQGQFRHQQKGTTPDNGKGKKKGGEGGNWEGYYWMSERKQQMHMEVNGQNRGQAKRRHRERRRRRRGRQGQQYTIGLAGWWNANSATFGGGFLAAGGPRCTRCTHWWQFLPARTHGVLVVAVAMVVVVVIAGVI